MDASVLNEQELKAIQEALRQNASRPQESQPINEAEVSPVMLLRDERAADQAKPNARLLGSHLVKTLPRSLFNLVGVRLEAGLQSVDVFSAKALREELEGCWLCVIEIPSRSSHALVTISGPMISALVVKSLGGGLEAQDNTPSQTTLRMFSSIGETLTRVVVDACRDELAVQARIIAGVTPKEFWRLQVPEDTQITAISVSLQGPTSGVFRVFFCPDALISARPKKEVAPASSKSAEEALGEVPVESSILLGKAPIKLSQLCSLTIGEVISLDRFLHEPVAVYCGGVLKAFGRVVLSGELLTVELTELAVKQR
jgi:flagellar motor switch protein FliN/FliY